MPIDIDAERNNEQYPKPDVQQDIGNIEERRFAETEQVRAVE